MLIFVVLLCLSFIIHTPAWRVSVSSPLVAHSSSQYCQSSTSLNTYCRRRTPIPIPNYLTNDKPVFVAGGGSGLGYEIVKKLSSLGTPVKALVRREEALNKLSQLANVEVMLGDAMNRKMVEKCMEGCVAVISTLGYKAGDSPNADGQLVDHAGNSNIIEEAGDQNVKRIIMVTSVGCGDTDVAISEETAETLSTILEAKNNAERDLMITSLLYDFHWTIIRPGSLTDDASSGKAILTEDFYATGTISRTDAADLIIKVLATTNDSCRRKMLTILDPSKSKADYEYKPFQL